jgi:NAD(P)-dependent dehydrogenase (short-subunit alcohol dehydrogenase family)
MSVGEQHYEPSREVPTLPSNIGISRTAVITGANTGLGYACAQALLASTEGVPWRVVLACRSRERAQAAVERLTETPDAAGRVEALSLDLGSLQSVRAFAAELADRIGTGALPPLHGLVCNAGVQSGATRSLTVEGFESTFGVNHLGHFLLVNLLLPMLDPPARVVVVASIVHDPAKQAGLPAPAWNDPVALARGELGPAAAGDKPLAAARRRYATSKLANVYFTYALARRLPDGVTANAFDPGLMPGTGLVREAPAPLRFANAHVLPHIIPLARRLHMPNIHTVKESGDSLARLLTDPALGEVTGKYFEGRQEIRSSEESYDQARDEELWRESETLTASGASRRPVDEDARPGRV